jgi:hypothetical protein
MSVSAVTRFLLGAWLPAALLLFQQTFAQSPKESAERFIADQERRWNISCRAVHPKAHQFVREYIPSLLEAGIDNLGMLQDRATSLSKEVSELSDQTLKCYGLEPAARNTGSPFQSDFGELHEVLRTAHEFIDSVIARKHEVLRKHNQRELQKRYDELKSGTGRRYRTRT